MDSTELLEQIIKGSFPLFTDTRPFFTESDQKLEVLICISFDDETQENQITYYPKVDGKEVGVPHSVLTNCFDNPCEMFPDFVDVDNLYELNNGLLSLFQTLQKDSLRNRNCGQTMNDLLVSVEHYCSPKQLRHLWTIYNKPNQTCKCTEKYCENMITNENGDWVGYDYDDDDGGDGGVLV